MRHNILKTIVFLLVSVSLRAQTYHHTTFWSRLAFQKTLKKWDFKVETDIRQQNYFEKSTINPFQKPFLRWLRLNSSYTTGRFTHSLILPQYTKNFQIIGKKEDLTKPPSYEWRYTVNEEYTLPYKKLNSALRLGYEYRNITSNGINRKTGRARIRLAETIKLTQRSSLNSSFEMLYNSVPNKVPNLFSSSQLAFRYLHKFGKNINFTTGLNHNFRQRNTIIEYDSENAILFNISIAL